MLKLKYLDLFFYSLVTFALVKIVNIIFTVIVSGSVIHVYYDITHLALVFFIYATCPIFKLKFFDAIPYRVLQIFHLSLFIGFTYLYLYVSSIFLPLNNTAFTNAIQSSLSVYIVMSIIIEIIERKRVSYYNNLIKNNTILKEPEHVK